MELLNKKILNEKRSSIVNLPLLIDKVYVIIFFLIVVIYSVNLFYNLGQSINDFDEGRHGVSAYEMVKSGNYIVNTYNYETDYWNLKPPLSFWAIAMGYKLVGFNPLGLRIGSAIFALITIIIISLYTRYKYDSISSIITMIVLSTSIQYLLIHGARSGDADSIFIMFFTIAIISMLLSDISLNWLYLTGLSFSLAFLTKSWHAGCIPIILLVYLVLTGKLTKLKLRSWLVLFIAALVPILIWGIIRFQYDGWIFFQKMITYDLLHRSSSAIEGHKGGMLFYLECLLRPEYRYWLGFLVLLLTFSVKSQMKNLLSEQGNSILGISLWIIIPILLFSFIPTKLDWYILPIFPPLSILIGILGGQIIKNLNLIYKLLIITITLLCFSYYELAILKSISNPTHDNVQSALYLLGKDKVDSNSKIIYSVPEWNQDNTLAAKLYNNFHPASGGIPAFIKNEDSLLLIPKDDLNSIPQEFGYKILENYRSIYIIEHKKLFRVNN
jgi:4-amino-4-deoxy-L-arabinose transferase-like glycosyltransferase